MRQIKCFVTKNVKELALKLGDDVCTEAGMFALRERRVHVTQEDFEMAVAKVMKKETEKNMSLRKLWK
ncbi:hypothetical protein JHK87_027681 [Glycine soja]|nr:hypothetical protein JHK87_027681 [Glycine soja]